MKIENIQTPSFFSYLHFNMLQHYAKTQLDLVYKNVFSFKFMWPLHEVMNIGGRCCLQIHIELYNCNNQMPPQRIMNGM